ncbi:MAG: efflux RND transporter periplasmic adaptor subunit [Acidobacteriia bacterium]|nr:efflux RND transporter periplasmic adaptor subunit [Terriglobia bacterium]
MPRRIVTPNSLRLLTRRLTLPPLAGLGLALALLGLSACSRQNAKSAPAAAPALAVRAVRVDPRSLDMILDVTGPLVSSVAVDVKTEFAGRLVLMLKQEGDRISQGERIAQLEPTNSQLAVNQARANLEVAKAALDRAKVAEDHARTEFERAQNLLKSGGITDRDFQAAQMTSRDASAQVKLAAAQVDQSRQTLAVAEKRLNDCRIIAPITGEVERKFVNPGSWVDGNALLYRLVDNQRLELQAYVASSDLARVRKGQRLRFGVAAYPGEDFEATIFTLSAAVDSQNRSVLLRAAVPNPSGKLRAGMFAKGAVITGTKPAALVVPVNALWRRTGQSPFVYVIDGSRARRREVETGLEQSQGIEIARGINPGDMVIAEQNLELGDGVSVTPRP